MHQVQPVDNIFSPVEVAVFPAQRSSRTNESTISKIFKQFTAERGGISSSLKLVGGILSATKVKQDVTAVFKTTGKVLSLFSLVDNLYWWLHIASDPEYREKQATASNLIRKSTKTASGSLNTLVWFESLGASLSLSKRTFTVGRIAVSSVRFSTSILSIVGLSVGICVQIGQIHKQVSEHQPGDPFNDRKYALELSKELIGLTINVMALAMVVLSLSLMLSGGGAGSLMMVMAIVSPGIGVCSVFYREYVDRYLATHYGGPARDDEFLVDEWDNSIS